MKLIADQKKPDPHALVEVPAAAAEAEEEIDFTAIVYALNLQQCLVDGAFPAAKLPQVVISTNGSKDKVLQDTACLHQNAQLLMQMIHRNHNGTVNNNHARYHDDDDDIASIVAHRQ